MSDIKRVTAMSFEDQDDDFLQNAKLTSPDQRSQKPDDEKNSHITTKPDSHQIPQIGSMTHKTASSVPPTQKDQKPIKKKRVKKTKAERLQLLKERLDKKLANAAHLQEEAELLQQKIAWVEKSPEERREYERSLDTHCKVLAGAIIINLYNDKNKKFDRETFKNLLFASLSRAEDITYFKKKLHE